MSAAHGVPDLVRDNEKLIRACQMLFNRGDEQLVKLPQPCRLLRCTRARTDAGVKSASTRLALPSSLG